MKIKSLLLAAALGAASLTLSQAISYTVGTGSSVDAHDSGPGLLIETSLSPTLAGYTFNLNDGQSTTFDFFTIWTDEGTVNWGEDTTPMPITATLNFAVPELDALITGVTFGGRLFLQGGVVLWDDPVLVTALDRQFSVALNNAIFDVDLFQLGDCPVDIQATVKQISSTGAASSVPDGGSTLVLLGLGLAGMGAARWRASITK